MCPSTAYVGNSIIAAGPWSSVCRASLNFGEPSATTRDILGRISKIMAAKPTRVVLMIGVNDPAKGITTEETVQNIHTLIAEIHSRGATVTLFALLPVSPQYHRIEYNRHITAINEGLPENSILLKIPFSHYTADGIHLRRSGYSLWTRKLRSLGICQ